MRRTAAKPPAATPTPERSTHETAPLDRRRQEDDPPTVPRRFWSTPHSCRPTADSHPYRSPPLA